MTSTPTANLAAEYKLLTTDAALINRTHLGRIEQSGADAIDLLHRLTTNTIETLEQGRAQETVLASDRGRVIDVFTVVRRPDDLLLLTSDALKQRLLDQIDFYTIIEDSQLTDISTTTVQIGVAGPKATARLSAITPLNLEPNTTSKVTIADGEVLILRRPPTAAVEYELITVAESAAAVEAALNAAGIPTVGTESFTAYTITSGIPTPGADFDERVNPLEAGFFDFIDFDKGCYVGQEVIARLDTYDKVQRHLIGMRSAEPVGQGDTLFSGDREIGWIGSVAESPTGPGHIALAYARNDFTEPGTIFTTQSGTELTVTALPMDLA